MQRLLLRSWSARCLAVRQVTQENRGKRTAGVDGELSVCQGDAIATQVEEVLRREINYVRDVHVHYRPSVN